MPADVLEFAQSILDECAGLLLSEALPDLHAQAVAQMDAVIGLLRGRGISVHQVSPLTELEQGYLADLGFGNSQQYFPRDPVLVVDDRYIELPMRYPMRRMERFGVRRAVQDVIHPSRMVAMPEAAPIAEDADGDLGPGPFLEGGDVLLLGDVVLVGISQNASNAAGVELLRGLLGDSHRVQAIRLSREFLHLDCVLATPREGLALACLEGFPDGLPAVLADWEVVPVDPVQAAALLATNVLVLDERTVLVAEETPEVADALTRAGQDVLTTPFSAISMWGGSFRCWHHPLRRIAASGQRASSPG
jgi:N-dimethylarginine dimethylaminohydrolase